MSRYEPVGILARHDAAVTEKVMDQAAGRYLVQKKVSLSDAVALKQARLELKALMVLNGVGAPALIDCYETETQLVLVESWIEGVPIGQAGKKRQTEAMRQVVQTIHRLHEHDLLYLDLKPEHIRLCETGAVLLDFNGCLEKGSTECWFAAPKRMAPELNRPIPKTEKADVYAVGTVLKELKLVPKMASRCLEADPISRPSLSQIFAKPKKRILKTALLSVFAAGLAILAAAGGMPAEREANLLGKLEEQTIDWTDETEVREVISLALESGSAWVAEEIVGQYQPDTLSPDYLALVIQTGKGTITDQQILTRKEETDLTVLLEALLKTGAEISEESAQSLLHEVKTRDQAVLLLEYFIQNDMPLPLPSAWAQWEQDSTYAALHQLYQFNQRKETNNDHQPA